MEVFDNIREKMWNETVANSPWMQQSQSKPQLIKKPYSNRPVVDRTTEIAEANLRERTNTPQVLFGDEAAEAMPDSTTVSKNTIQHMNDDIVDMDDAVQIAQTNRLAGFTQYDKINLGRGNSTIRIGGKDYNVWNKNDMISLQKLLQKAGFGEYLKGKNNGVDGIFGFGTANALAAMMQGANFNGNIDYTGWRNWVNEEYQRRKAEEEERIRQEDIRTNGGKYYYSGAPVNNNPPANKPNSSTPPSPPPPPSPVTSGSPINTNNSGLTFKAGDSSTKWGGGRNDLDDILDLMGYSFGDNYKDNPMFTSGGLGSLVLTDKGAQDINKWLTSHNYLPRSKRNSVTKIGNSYYDKSTNAYYDIHGRFLSYKK